MTLRWEVLSSAGLSKVHELCSDPFPENLFLHPLLFIS